ncbi:MAG: N-acetylmuramoyl-L-alanine amidase [Vicinamibacterales bacterium]
MRSFARLAVIVTVAVVVHGAPGLAVPAVAQSPSAQERYERAQEQERAVRRALESNAPTAAVLRRVRSVIAAYEGVPRAFPRSGYSDNALWQGAKLAADVWARGGQAADRARALAMFDWLAREYPSSSLAREIDAERARLTTPPPGADQALYTAAFEREQALRARLASRPQSQAVADLRALAVEYEGVPRRFPRSGYSDNALWQGAQLAEEAYIRSNATADRQRALTLLAWLVREYPTSSLVPEARTASARLERERSDVRAAAARPAARSADDAVRTASVPAPAPDTDRSAPAPPVPAIPAPAGRTTVASATTAAPASAETAGALTVSTPPAAAPVSAAAPPASAPVGARLVAPAPAASTSAAPVGLPRLTSVRRDVLPDVLRVTLEMERESPFRDERQASPARVLVDLQAVGAVEALENARLAFDDDVVREIQVVPASGSGVRVVLGLGGEAPRHSVYALYNPYRVVVDFERPPSLAAAPGRPATPASQPSRGASTAAAAATGSGAASSTASAAGTAPGAPTAPAANRAGGFSMSRQLGLGVSRVVIDPGHGGRDPGARSNGAVEADIVLDIALRLETLLLAQPGVEVVMTRRTDVFVPLEERTAIANRAEADLFLSIHANASASGAGSGIETYFLNFATNPAAEAIAARENAGSARTMAQLPDIVRAIALNNKLDESRDFATMVQRSLFQQVRKVHPQTRNLGVKQAPFVVLIGATMPSVLAEVSFITDTREGRLLRTAGYRQQLAEALFEGVAAYQRSLKASATVAAQE